MAIDTRFILAFPFEQYFVDKDTGLPLAAGTVKFFEDVSRTTPKSVYIISGSPPNYTYIDIGNVVTLDAVGVPSYLGANVALYFFPYESFTPGAAIQLYYIECFSSGGVSQFTREGIPNIAVTSEPEQEFKNYIPNGQFLLHTDIAAQPPNVAGQITSAITNIAYGGWTFERPNGSFGTDIVLFQRQNSIQGPPNHPENYPRYILEIQNTVVGTDTFKDLRVKFLDVNKFASSSQTYTFAFTAQSNDISNIPVSLYLIKNFGTGGSPETSTLLTLFSVSNAVDIYSFKFVFGTNESKTLGTDDTDFVQLALRLPTDSQFDISFSDFILAFGSVTITNFPPTPDSEFEYEAVAGFLSTPAYDGSDLYLPVKLTQSGLTYDDSEVGDVIAESQLSVYVNSLHPTTNRMLADGSQYETSKYSPLGIPYARLQAKYYDTTTNMPRYGTGVDYFSAYIFSTATSQLIINNNNFGAVTNASDGSAPTGFTIATIHTGATYHQVSYIYNSTGLDNFVIQGNTFGPFPTNPSAGTSGFVVQTLRDKPFQKPQILVTVSALPAAGTYFTYKTATDAYYVWFKIDGVGVDPAVATYTGIEVDLLSTDSVNVASEKIRQSLNGWQVTTVITAAGSTITGGDFFNIYSTTQQYYVWYKVGTVGTDPGVVGALPIEVDILTTDTAAQVATKTMIAINSKYFGVPDYRGYFLRGFNNGATVGETVDPTVDFRYSLVPGITGDEIGTFEVYDYPAHLHGIGTVQINEGASGNFLDGIDDTNPATQNTEYSGAYESVPINASVNLVIKY